MYFLSVTAPLLFNDVSGAGLYFHLLYKTLGNPVNTEI